MLSKTNLLTQPKVGHHRLLSLCAMSSPALIPGSEAAFNGIPCGANTHSHLRSGGPKSGRVFLTLKWPPLAPLPFNSPLFCSRSIYREVLFRGPYTFCFYFLSSGFGSWLLLGAIFRGLPPTVAQKPPLGPPSHMTQPPLATRFPPRALGAPSSQASILLSMQVLFPCPFAQPVHLTYSHIFNPSCHEPK